MDDTTSFILDQTDEDILNPTVSDEALEAAAVDQPGVYCTGVSYKPGMSSYCTSMAWEPRGC
jgi:hypothetical protein